jgi:Ser/Thr protein kinase RdoA (MazF antagonist)
MMLGDLIGEGRTAEVFLFGADRVVKLMRPGFDSRSLITEAERAAAAFRAGAPAPKVIEMVEVDGRRGIVFERVSGPSMLDELLRGAAANEMAIQLASLHSRLLKLHAQGLPDVRDRLADRIDEAGLLTLGERRACKDSLSDLPDGTSLLHGDFHPGNVHLTSSRRVVIDWMDAARGAPAADVARTMLLGSPATIPPDTPDRGRLVGVIEHFRARYAERIHRHPGCSAREVEGWALPVAAARLSEGIAHEEPSLVTMVRRALL